MHGLINKAIERFAIDTYGPEFWQSVAHKADIDRSGFEAMLCYDDAVTLVLISVLADTLKRPREDVLEDIGTYLVSHPNTQALRRLLRFGGVTFVDFLESLDDLPDRARLAVADLTLPKLTLRAHGEAKYSLRCEADHPGWGHVLAGILRALADDYGALVYLEPKGGAGGSELVEICLLEQTFAEGNRFEFGAAAG